MNIIGEGFPDKIIEQVKQRQKAYGSGYIDNRTPEQIVFLNGNTSWCNLVSSVNIVDSKSVRNDTIKELTFKTENELAKRFVLRNGVAKDNAEQRAGINYNPSSILGGNNAYGIGGTEFGIRPMMGIQSAEIKHENRGSIRRATVKIKAWNKKQFDIIDILYLRLGFDMLLEWGHSMYYDNAGVLQTKIDNSLATEFLTGEGTVNVTEQMFNMATGQPYTVTKPKYVKNMSYANFLNLIQDRRLNSYGNYDAMFAKVSNFHWSFLPDGSYDITLDLVSVGDVMESFKINALVGGLPSSNSPTTSWIDVVTLANEEDISKLDDANIIALFANKHTIGQWFSTLVSAGSGTAGFGIPPGAPVPGPPPNYTDSEYKAFADIIFDAFSGWSTKHSAILDVFKKMKNKTDFEKLVEAYGTRTIPGGPLMPDVTGDLYKGLVEEYSDEQDNYKELEAALKANGVIE